MIAGIIIPYRDRLTNLKAMLPILVQNLRESNINYKIYIINQNDDRLFNKGSLINIGVNIAFNECDYLIIHDVDNVTFTKDIYKFNNISSNLVLKNSYFKGNENDNVYDGYFGGVLIFKKEDFIKINGFSNKYWGWGCEDDESKYRCMYNKIKMTREKGCWTDLYHKGKRFNDNPEYKNNCKLLNTAINKNYDFQKDGYKQIKYEIESFVNINNDFITKEEYKISCNKIIYAKNIMNLIDNKNFKLLDDNKIFMYNVFYLNNLSKYTLSFELGGEIFPDTNVFNKFFSKHLQKHNNIKNNKDCNIIIRSCLSGNIWNTNKKPYIYWSGENRIPEKSTYESSSIYITTTFLDLRNSIYIPYCLESHHIYKERLYKNNNRKYFIGYCASHKVNIREDLFNKCVEKIGINNCISYGNCYGKFKETNFKCDGDYQNLGLINKYSNCIFIIAMENSIGDGYVTEKIVNAFYSGAIPIYWGSANINDFFNKEAFINVSDFKDLDECIDYIVNLSKEKINYMQKQPIYNDNDLINIFNDEYNKQNDNKILKEYTEKINNFIQHLHLSR
jgi:hypothetical protein